MEGINIEGGAGALAHLDGWRAWEAAPRDGPAIFVIDTRVFDDDGEIRGRWLDPNIAPEVLYEQVRALLGREPVEGSWAIIDQVGLGPLMVPETLGVNEVRSAAEELAGGAPW